MIDTFKTGFSACVAALAGIFLAYGFITLVSSGPNLADLFSSIAHGAPVEETPERKGIFVRVDLEAKQIALFADGVRVASYAIVKLPASRSPWDLRVGSYEVRAKEELHTSPISSAKFPFAISLGANAMITGPAEPTDASGGVELALSDSEALFQKLSIGDKISVVGEGPSHSYVERLRVGGSDETAFFPDDFLKTAPVTSEAYLVGDLDTGEILLEKNKDRILPIASVSKLVTGLVAEEVSATGALPSSRLFGLKYEELLYPMLLESNNAAAEELARLFGWDEFIAQMNEKVRSLGLFATSFEDPSGLSPRNRSTAGDLFLLARQIYEHEPELLAITREKLYGRWRNTNRYIVGNDTRYLGGKTGYIPEAGQTFVTLFSFPLSEFERKNIAVILLKSANRYRDVTRITEELSRSLYKPGGRGESMLALDPEILDRNAKKNTLIFGGDLMFDRDVRVKVEARCSGDYSCIFEHAGILKSGDITFANLEGPVSDKGYDLGNLYSFRMSPAVPRALREAGIDVVSVANNHMGDWGRGAFEDTLARLSDAELVAVGGGMTREDAKGVRVLERNGVRFGFVAFSDVGPSWLAEPPTLPSMLLANDPEFAKIITDAKAACDVLVVSFHFGEEYADLPTSRQIALARKAVDLGAKIVVGHHPHVAQRIEKYGSGLIAYSLGNLVFDQTFSKETMEAHLLEVHLDGAELSGFTEHVGAINSVYQPVFTPEL